MDVRSWTINRAEHQRIDAFKLWCLDSKDILKEINPVLHHQLPEFAQTHVHGVSDAFQPSHPLSSPSSPAFSLSQHQGLSQWVNSHQVAKVDSILKSRDITLSTKVHLVRAMVFPVVMYGYESWTIMKAECWRTDAFELWCWRILLRVP